MVSTTKNLLATGGEMARSQSCPRAMALVADSMDPLLVSHLRPPYRTTSTTGGPVGLLHAHPPAPLTPSWTLRASSGAVQDSGLKKVDRRVLLITRSTGLSAASSSPAALRLKVLAVASAVYVARAIWASLTLRHPRRTKTGGVHVRSLATAPLVRPQDTL